ncbi:MAG: outer membrane protein OmpK [Campylobacterota bacterium]
MRPSLLASLLLASALHGFSTTNLQYLYGSFEGPTFLDTVEGAKHTLTAEHYRTFGYGDVFAFVDYVYTPKGLRFSGKKNDLYGEFSPRISFNKIADLPVSSGVFKEWYAAYQHNRADGYRADLYGVGCDLNIPGFDVFSLNGYRKARSQMSDTYQLSGNYSAALSEAWLFEGYFDWTGADFLTQNQLLFNLSPFLGIREGQLRIGTEWHYYRENGSDTDNDVFQAMIKYSW